MALRTILSKFFLGFQRDRGFSIPSSTWTRYTSPWSVYYDSEDEDDYNDTQSVVSSVYYDSDFGDDYDVDDTFDYQPVRHEKPKLLQRKVRVRRDVLKFISNRSKFYRQLEEELETMSADFELFPNKSQVVVTKRPGSKYIKNWSNCSASVVRTFFSRFVKECFDINYSERLKKELGKLRRKLRSGSAAACWIRDSNTKLAVMTERDELDRVLEIVEKFLSDKGSVTLLTIY